MVWSCMRVYAWFPTQVSYDAFELLLLDDKVMLRLLKCIIGNYNYSCTQLQKWGLSHRTNILIRTSKANWDYTFIIPYIYITYTYIWEIPGGVCCYQCWSIINTTLNCCFNYIFFISLVLYTLHKLIKFNLQIFFHCKKYLLFYVNLKFLFSFILTYYYTLSYIICTKTPTRRKGRVCFIKSIIQWVRH